MNDKRTNVFLVIADSSDYTISYGVDVQKDLIGVFSEYEDAKDFVFNLVAGLNCDDRDDCLDDEPDQYRAGCFLPANEHIGRLIFEDSEPENDTPCTNLDIMEVPLNQHVCYNIASAFYAE